MEAKKVAEIRGKYSKDQWHNGVTNGIVAEIDYQPFDETCR